MQFLRSKLETLLLSLVMDRVSEIWFFVTRNQYEKWEECKLNYGWTRLFFILCHNFAVFDDFSKWSAPKAKFFCKNWRKALFNLRSTQETTSNTWKSTFENLDHHYILLLQNESLNWACSICYHHSPASHSFLSRISLSLFWCCCCCCCHVTTDNDICTPSSFVFCPICSINKK